MTELQCCSTSFIATLITFCNSIIVRMYFINTSIKLEYRTKYGVTLIANKKFELPKCSVKFHGAQM